MSLKETRQSLLNDVAEIGDLPTSSRTPFRSVSNNSPSSARYLRVDRKGYARDEDEDEDVPRRGNNNNNTSSSSPMSFDRLEKMLTIEIFNTQISLISALLQISLISIMTAEVLFRKASTTIYMRNYRTFLNTVIVFAAALVFFAIIFYKKYINHTLEETINKRLFYWFSAIAFFDTLATYMIMLSATYVTAPVQTMLSQGVIPFSIICSILIMKRRFHWMNYLGAAIIIGAIGLSVGLSHDNDDDGESTEAGWAIVFLLANIPIVLSSILKEMCGTSPQPAEMNSLNAWVAFIQFFMGLALAPAGYILQAPGGRDSVQVSSLPSNFVHGFDCWLKGENSITTGVDHPDDCGQAPWIVWTHIVLVVILNIVALLIIYRNNAVMFFIAGAVSIPLTQAVSSFAFMGPIRVAFDWVDIVAAVLTIVGLLVYQAKQMDEPPPPDVQPIVDSDDVDGNM